MKTNREKVIGSQVVSAELVTGLLLSMAYRMFLAFSSEVGLYVCKIMGLYNVLFVNVSNYSLRIIPGY